MVQDYLNIGNASDLKGKDKRAYRLLEIMPGFFAWITIIATVLISRYAPIYAAFFIISFDLYWLIKTAYLSMHLRANWKKMRHHMNLDWEEKIKNFNFGHIWQMVILPVYKEGGEIIKATMDSIAEAKWNKEKTIIVLAYEERAGQETEDAVKDVYEIYKNKFNYFLPVKHPAGLPGDAPGKGSNIAYAAEEAKKKILDANKIKMEDVLVSAFDIDTRVYDQYFLCLAWHFLACDKPYQSSFQPVPVYNNNIWDAPAFSRVVAISGTFWQMVQQERPERLATFSSHSISFKALHDAGYWQRNIVSEDSRIFWKAFLKSNGDYSVVPISYPVSMDANLGPNIWQTAKNVYKQQLRWTWGVENLPYIIFNFIKNDKISAKKKLYHIFTQMEGFWSLSTNPLMIFLLGWLPLAIGGSDFNQTLISYTLPRVTRNLMILAMMGLVLSAILSLSLLPPLPKNTNKHKYFFMVFQWILIPFTLPIFGAIPGMHSQTRLMIGKYLGFWVTPKHRKRILNNTNIKVSP